MNATRPPPRIPEALADLAPDPADLRNGVPLVRVEVAHPTTPTVGPGANVQYLRLRDDGLRARDPAVMRAALDADPVYGRRLAEGVRVGFRLEALPLGDTSRRHLPPSVRWLDVPAGGQPPALVARPPEVVVLAYRGRTLRVRRTQGTDEAPVYGLTDVDLAILTGRFG